MSIWASLSDTTISALDGHDEGANYRAEGEPSLEVDLATTNYHDHVRLAVWNTRGEAVDVCALLSPAAAQELHRQLGALLTAVGQFS